MYQNVVESTDLATDHRGHDGPSWTPSSHTCTISFSTLFVTLDGGYDARQRHNGPSMVSVPKHLNSWNMGTGLLL